MISLFDLLFTCNNKSNKLNEKNFSLYTPYNENFFYLDDVKFNSSDNTENQTNLSSLDIIDNTISLYYTEGYTSPNYYENCVKVLAYNKYINSIFPLEYTGETFLEMESDSKYLYAIVSNENSIYKVGDITNFYFSIPNSNEMKNIKIKIVGVLKKPSYVLNLMNRGNLGSTDIFENISSEYTGEITFIIEESQLKTLGIEFYKQPTDIIIYKDISNSSDIFSLETHLRNLGLVISKQQFLETTDDSFSWVKNQYLPKLYFTVIVALATMIATSIINTEKSVRSMQIFFLCGSRWKDCLLISLSNSFIITLFAGLPAFLMFFTSYKLNLSLFGSSYASYRTYFCCGLVLTLFFIISTISSLLILKYNNPQKIIFKI